MRTKGTIPQSLSESLRRVLILLRKVRPERSDSDTLWKGFYFVSRPREWHPVHFLLYRKELFASLEMGWSTVTLAWDVGTNRASFEGRTPLDSRYENGPVLWQAVLAQVERQVRRALGDPGSHHRKLERALPLRCRTGRMRRWLTWPRNCPPPLPTAKLRRLERALRKGVLARSLRALTVQGYLRVAAIAYDAVYPEMKGLSARVKHKRKADTRDGGMLELRAGDAKAFLRWYRSRKWSGAHPFEIVFAHPDGILLSPLHGGRGWRFCLRVDHLGHYVSAARMAIALGERGIPFELRPSDEILAALRGEDWVEIGPFHGQLALSELRQRNRQAQSLIEWDPVPAVYPV